MKSITVAAHTLGCKVNQCDTEAILELLVSIGCNICEFNKKADIYIINTCTVTHASDKKSRQIIRRAKKHNPSAMVAVCGCMAQKDPVSTNELGVDFIFDARKPENFINNVRVLLDANGIGGPAKPTKPDKSRTRGFIKIQDGCDRFCSYCIVPYVRGKPKSRPVQDIISEAASLITSGIQEIVITGIQVASYGEDTKDTNLPGLLSRMLAINGLVRLRLSSLEPNVITEEFLNAASSQILCDHFHLSLQSGSDTVLQRMNRHYSTAEYAQVVANIRKIWPEAAITTDIIVGFPGETENEFNETLNFLKKINFAGIHVFEYSKREGTPAATFPNQVLDKVKTERSREVRTLAAELQLGFYKSQIGKTVAVLFENSKSYGEWLGHTSNYCPVLCKNNANLSNTICMVKIIGYNENGLEGEIMVDNSFV